MLVSKCMHMTILMWSSVSVIGVPCRKRILCAWLRDLIRGMRDARLGGFQGWLYCVVKDGGFTTQEFMGFNDEIEVL